METHLGGKTATLFSSYHPGLLKQAVMCPKKPIKKAKGSLGFARLQGWPILSEAESTIFTLAAAYTL